MAWELPIELHESERAGACRRARHLDAVDPGRALPLRACGRTARRWCGPEQATEQPWILDCDTTIKVLYGKQDAAVVSYNPHKPGRPSHAIHTYWIGNLRLVLDAQLEPGNRHSPVHARPGLMALLEGMPQAQRPKLVRGDCAFGSEGEMSALEAIDQPYLFKLRQSAGSAPPTASA